MCNARMCDNTSQLQSDINSVFIAPDSITMVFTELIMMKAQSGCGFKHCDMPTIHHCSIEYSSIGLLILDIYMI